MDDLLIALLVVAAVVTVIIVSVRRAGRVTGDRPEDVAERIVELLNEVAREPLEMKKRAELLDALTGHRLPFLPALTSDGGWFDRSAAALVTLGRRQDTCAYVQWYFQRVDFPAGQKQKPLLWLYNFLRSEVKDVGSSETCAGAAERLLASARMDEAMWLYQRTLEVVQESHGAPDVKAAAVRIGRIAYSSARPDRRPTIYDEQAIANDVAARC